MLGPVSQPNLEAIKLATVVSLSVNTIAWIVRSLSRDQCHLGLSSYSFAATISLKVRVDCHIILVEDEFSRNKVDGMLGNAK